MARPTNSKLAGAAWVAVAALSACSDGVKGDAVYSAAQCRRVAIIDAVTNKEIVGAEDLAYDAAERRLFISAYDRRAVERAAAAKDEILPEGGLYSIALDLLEAADATVKVERVTDGGEFVGGLRPHGLSFDPATREILFINRAFQKIEDAWRMSPQIERIGADGTVATGVNASRCSANDLAASGGETLVSFDHADCGWRGFVEDVIGSKASGLSTVGGAAVFDGVRHANGVAALGDGRIALAATRDKAVFILSRRTGVLAIEKRLEAQGAPDNLSVTADGEIVAALHPSLLSIGFHRKLGLGKAGSRIVRIDPQAGAVTVLFNDPKAALFSAATAAIEANGTLVAGSVLDKGLLVCSQATP